MVTSALRLAATALRAKSSYARLRRALDVIPAFLGRVPFSSGAIALMRPVMFASLAEHVVYGAILGFVFVRITKCAA
jgi:hypothetical protein